MGGRRFNAERAWLGRSQPRFERRGRLRTHGSGSTAASRVGLIALARRLARRAEVTRIVNRIFDQSRRCQGRFKQMIALKSNFLRGSYTPVVTPFRDTKIRIASCRERSEDPWGADR